MVNHAKGDEVNADHIFKSNSSDMVIPLLKHAMNREKRILMETLRITKEKISSLTGTLGVDPDKLMKGEVEHTESNDMQLIA